MISKKLNTKINEEWLMIHTNLFEYIQNIDNKIADILIKLTNSPAYKEDVNFLNLAKEFNMISYLPSKNITSYKSYGGELDMEEYYDSKKRISIRIGRLIRKIINDINNSVDSKYEYTGDIDITNFGFSTELSFISDKRFIYIPGFTKSTLDIENKKNGEKFKLSNLEIEEFSVYRTDYNESTTTIVFDKNGDKYIISIPENEKTKFGNIIKSSVFAGKINLKTNIDITDSDIEKFYNELSSVIRLSRPNEDTKLELVKGDDIPYYYDESRVQVNSGKLGNSCMNSEGISKYFEIYSKNPEKISMLILRNIKTDKILGRSLIWKLDDGDIFMDRVYTINELDEKIFVEYAIDNNYIYRSNNRDCIFYRNKKEIENFEMYVTLKNVNFRFYPYLDTLKYLSLEFSQLSNNEDMKYDFSLTCTNGDVNRIENGKPIRNQYKKIIIK